MAPKTKDRILATSLRLFNENGYDAVTTAKISEEVGISEGNLWYHFRTKRDLVSAHQLALFVLIDKRLAIPSTPETVVGELCSLQSHGFRGGLDLPVSLP
ncbi:TetR/AcrR family transcriptional regulator [Parvibaculum sp.]|uniref:TetR/AcrR family transcriptional regulator n=1 Tax=Parvibaculum sp. TaxID=2024848 RepID=UPI003BAB4D6F